MFLLKKYGVATSVSAPLLTPGSEDMIPSDPGGWESNDIHVKLDAASFGARAGSPGDPTFEGRGWVDIPLVLEDLEAAVILVSLQDQTPTKAWQDQNLIICTYGHVSALIKTDLDKVNLDVDIIDVKGTLVNDIDDFKAVITSLATQANIGTASSIDGNNSDVVGMIQALFSANNGTDYTKSLHSLKAQSEKIDTILAESTLENAYAFNQNTGTVISGAFGDTADIDNTLFVLAPFGGSVLSFNLSFKTDTLDKLAGKIMMVANYVPNAVTEYIIVKVKNVFTGLFEELTSLDYKIENSANRISYTFSVGLEHVDNANGEVVMQFVSTDIDTLSRFSIDYVGIAMKGIEQLTLGEFSRSLLQQKIRFDLIGGDTVQGALANYAIHRSTLAAVTDASNIQIPGTFNNTIFANHPIRIQDKLDPLKVETKIISTFDTSGNIVLKNPLTFIPTVGSSAIIIAKSSINSEGSDGITLATAQPNFTPAIPGDQMMLSDDAITASKFDESSSFPTKADDIGSTLIARSGSDGDNLKTLSDQLDALSAQITALSTGNSDFQAIVQVQSLIPETSFTMYRVDVLYKNAGIPKDPTANELVLQVKDVNGNPKIVLFDDNLATTPATVSVTAGFENHYILIREDTGRYFTFYKVDNSEAELQWSFNFLLKDPGILPFISTTLLVSALTSEVTLAAVTQNFDVLARGQKEHDASSVSVGSGSNLKLQLDDNAAQTVKIDTVQSTLDDGSNGLVVIKSQTQSIEDKVNTNDATTNTINATTSDTNMIVGNIETKVDAQTSTAGTPPNFGSGATLADNNRDMAGSGFVAGSDSLEQLKIKLGTILLSNLNEISGSALGATNLKSSTEVMEIGTVDDSIISPTTTTFSSNIVHPVPQAFNRRGIYFIDGNLVKQFTKVLDYQNISGRWVFTVEELTAIPQNGDNFLII